MQRDRGERGRRQCRIEPGATRAGPSAAGNLAATVCLGLARINKLRAGHRREARGYEDEKSARRQLYDIDADRTEMHDVAAETPRRVEELAKMQQAWADRAGVIEWRSRHGGIRLSPVEEQS